MAHRIWAGGAPAVAHVATATFGTYDVTTTRTITIGSFGIGAADSGGTLTTALTALAVLLNASTHPYFSKITWTSSATQIIGTADTAGIPFVFIASVAGGTGTVSSTYAVSTLYEGPNDWNTPENWSGAAVPVNSDDVTIPKGTLSILWGLDQDAVTLASLTTNPGQPRIGLPYTSFITSVAASTSVETVSDIVEYRQDSLKVKVNGLAELWRPVGPDVQAGNGRCKIDFSTQAVQVRVWGTGRTKADGGLPATRLLATSSTTDIYVHSAEGGLGIAVGKPGETSTIGDLVVTAPSAASKVFVGTGVTLTNYEQTGGENTVNGLAATLTSMKCHGGFLLVNGDFTITTLTVRGGEVEDNHIKTAGSAVTTANLYGGLVDTRQSQEPRTWTTVNLYPGGALDGDESILTITTLNEKERYSLRA